MQGHLHMYAYTMKEINNFALTHIATPYDHLLHLPGFHENERPRDTREN